MIVNEFGGLPPIPGPSALTGDAIVNTFNVVVPSAGAAIAIIIGFGILFRILAFFALKFTISQLGG